MIITFPKKSASKKGAVYLAVIIIIAILVLVIMGWAVFIKGVPQIMFILQQLGIMEPPEDENQDLTLADFQAQKEIIQNYLESVKDKIKIKIIFRGEIHQKCAILPDFACPDYRFEEKGIISFMSFEDKILSFKIDPIDLVGLGEEETPILTAIDFVDEIELKAKIKTKIPTETEKGQSAVFKETIKVEKPEEKRPEQDITESRVPINTIEIEIPMLDENWGFRYDAVTNKKLGIILGVFEYTGFDQRIIYYKLKPAYTYPEENTAQQDTGLAENPFQNPAQPLQPAGVT